MSNGIIAKKNHWPREYEHLVEGRCCARKPVFFRWRDVWTSRSRQKRENRRVAQFFLISWERIAGVRTSMQVVPSPDIAEGIRFHIHAVAPSEIVQKNPDVIL